MTGLLRLAYKGSFAKQATAAKPAFWRVVRAASSAASSRSRVSRVSRAAGVSLLLLVIPLLTQATEVYAPPELDEWREWVMHGKDNRECPFLFDRTARSADDFVCAWPGELNIDVTATGGRFTQQWTTYADEQWLPLPGDVSHWPDEVSVNGVSAIVVMRDGIPQLRLPPGRYTITGSFAWDERPGVLQVPGSAGLVSLTVDGRRVAQPTRGRAGLFLGERREETQAQNAIRTNAYRLVSDDVPTRLTTQLRIDVSGSVREELFGPLLPEEFVPLVLSSQLPARLEPDGRLRLQVRPGTWSVTLEARADAVRDAIRLPVPERNMPATEIWSYRANDRLRVTAAQGLSPVDPQQMQVPAAWHRLPAFRIEPGQALRIEERSRGKVAVDNELTLRRQMWLDFSGHGFTVKDRIGGIMRTGWRLDMQPPYRLLSAREDDENLLVTQGAEDGATGVELRRSNVDVEALGRAERQSDLPVTGWDARFVNVAAELHLPPGHKLLAAPGVDRAPGTWTARWQLLDFFLVLITTIAAWRLLGRGAGAVAFFALTLSFHEPNAPSWLWLNLLIAIALIRVAPAGRLRRFARGYQVISSVLLVLVLVPFIAAQLRIAIYPQLEPQHRVIRVDMREPTVAATPMTSSLEADAVSKAGEAERRLQQIPAQAAPGEFMDVSQKALRSYARYAPNAIVQAGPGVPSWEWNSYALSFGGPVDADQSMRLIVMPRWLVTALRIIEVFLLLLFTANFVTAILERPIRLPGGVAFGKPWVASMLIVGLALTPALDGGAARADMPSPNLLEELEQRLLEPPACVPRCAEIVSATVAVDATSLRMRLIVHALAEVAVPVPGAEQGWRPAAIRVNGGAAGEVVRGPDEVLWLRLPAGRHEVVLRGAVPDVDSLEVPFPSPPRVIEVTSDGWLITGIKDRRLLSGSLQLTRLESREGQDGIPRWEASRFPPFVRIERTVELDLDWHVSTIVTRIAPEPGALSLDVPLLADEAVITDGMSVSDGKMLVSMNPNQRVVSWRSSLPRTPVLTLTADAGVPWQEVWRIGVGSIWHAEFDGVPESESPAAGADARLAEFFPRGGEALTIRAVRPEASPGRTLAFDSVALDIAHGNRSSTATLALSYRSTRGAQHTLRLPAGAEVTEVSIDGRIEPLRAENGDLTVPILPGEHRIRITWRSSDLVTLKTETSDIDIAAPASNVALATVLPANRWLLATNGPPLGPAVLYWSELAVLILFAAVLGRTGLTPLRTWHWLLLGLGFSTFSWPVLGVVVAWLLACGLRERWRTDVSWWQFNLIQMGLAGLTIVALSAIVGSLPGGLLGAPNMHVTGNDSYGNTLRWFSDGSDSTLPIATAWTVPMWIYKALILAWALWLSFALLRWLPWVWRCFTREGYWRDRQSAALRESGSGE